MQTHFVDKLLEQHYHNLLTSLLQGEETSCWQVLDSIFATEVSYRGQMSSSDHKFMYIYIYYYYYLLYLARNRSEICNVRSRAGIEPAALGFRCSALTNWATGAIVELWPQVHLYVLFKTWAAVFYQIKIRGEAE